MSADEIARAMIHGDEQWGIERNPSKRDAEPILRGDIPCEFHRPGQRFVDIVRGVVDDTNLPASGSDFKYTGDIRAI